MRRGWLEPFSCPYYICSNRSIPVNGPTKQSNYTQNNFYNIQVNYQAANRAASSLMWVCFVVHTAPCSQQCREIASTVVHKSASADSLHCTLTAQQSAAHLAKYSVSRVSFNSIQILLLIVYLLHLFYKINSKQVMVLLLVQLT